MRVYARITKPRAVMDKPIAFLYLSFTIHPKDYPNPRGIMVRSGSGFGITAVLDEQESAVRTTVERYQNLLRASVSGGRINPLPTKLMKAFFPYKEEFLSPDYDLVIKRE